MLPNKFKPLEKSKLYKAIKFYRYYDDLFIPKDSIDSYEKIEYLTILYAIGYISKDGGIYGNYTKIH